MTRSSLEDFRRRYPYRSVEVAGRCWRYIDTGAGERALVVFAGGTTVAEVSFATLGHFAARYRVIAPDYPPVDTVAELFDGLLGLLEHLGVERFDALGGSYGSYMVQGLVRRCPARIDRVVATLAGPPSPDNSAKLSRMLVLMRLLPMGLLRRLLIRSFARLDTGERTPQLDEMWGLIDEVVRTRLHKPDLLALTRRLIDQTSNHPCRVGDLDDWPGQMLVVLGADDPGTPSATVEAMRELYPRATFVVLPGDHMIPLTERERYLGAIDEFLAAAS